MIFPHVIQCVIFRLLFPACSFLFGPCCLCLTCRRFIQPLLCPAAAAAAAATGTFWLWTGKKMMWWAPGRVCSSALLLVLTPSKAKMAHFDPPVTLSELSHWHREGMTAAAHWSARCSRAQRHRWSMKQDVTAVAGRTDLYIPPKLCNPSLFIDTTQNALYRCKSRPALGLFSLLINHCSSYQNQKK